MELDELENNVVVYVTSRPKPSLKSAQLAWLHLLPEVIEKSMRAG